MDYPNSLVDVDLYNGKFTDGDPLANIPASRDPASHMNAVTDEIINFIVASGQEPDEFDLHQLRKGIQSMIVSAQRAVVIDNAVFTAGVSDQEIVYWDAANSLFDLAIANGGAQQNAVGVADVTNGKVYAFGSCPIMTDLTPGRYYLSAATAGALTSIAPAAGVVQIGIAKSATELFVDIDAIGGGGEAAGFVKFFGGETAPAGYLKLNGAGILVASYPALTTAVYVGDANNATAQAFYRADNADGTSRNIAGAYLILRDARGEFFRAWDDGRGVDAGRALGSWQDHMLEAHSHTYRPGSVQGGSGYPGGSSANWASGSTGTTGGSETRPRNIAYLACIKY